MRNSKETKRDMRKATLVGLLFLAFIIVFSYLIFIPYGKVWSSKNRYDTLFVGASRTYKSIMPWIYDEIMGGNCYITASDSCSPEARYYLTEAALEGDAMRTVVLDISYDALFEYNYDDEYVFDIAPMSKMEGLGRKLKFGLNKFNFWQNHYDNVYPTLLSYGWQKYQNKVTGNVPPDDTRFKGFVYFGQVDRSLTLQEAIDTHDTEAIDTNYDETRKAWIDKLIQLCQEKGVRIVVINVPDTEKKMWQNVGWEPYQAYLEGLHETYGIEVINFDLLKDRQDYFQDNYHFADDTHLCDLGAEVFTPLLADYLVRSAAGEDISQDFYDNYEEAKAACVYAQMVEEAGAQ